MEVKDVMTGEVLTVAPEASLKQVAATLLEHSISGLPVCGPDGAVLGVVSEADILAKERGPAQQRRRRPLFWVVESPTEAEAAKAGARTAGEAMTRPAITIGPHRPVAAAARLMLESGVNRLPVVLGERLVGIVTRADLVRAFHRTDEQIAGEIRTDVVERMLWLPAGAVEVAVENGEVTLHGEVEGRSDAQLLPKLVARVPGVVSVVCEVGWRFDDTGRKADRPTASRL